MNAFFSSQVGYCLLVWMVHNKRYNNKRNCLHERMLRIVQKVYQSSFAELLSEDKSFTVHHKNVQKLAIEMYKVKNELCVRSNTSIQPQKQLNMWFLQNQNCTLWYRNHYLPQSKNLVNYSRRNKRICIIRNIPSKNQVMKTKQQSMLHLQKIHYKC